MSLADRVRGDYRPPRLPSRAVAALLWVTVVQAVSRAADYGTGRDWTPLLSTVEEALPRGVWVGLLAGGAALLAVGLLARRWTPALLGHAVLSITWAGLALGIGWEVVIEGPPWDTIRGATTLLTPIAVQLVVGVVTLLQLWDRQEGR